MERDSDIPYENRSCTCTDAEKVTTYTVCDLDGTLVIDRDKHSAWHDRLRGALHGGDMTV